MAGAGAEVVVADGGRVVEESGGDAYLKGDRPAMETLLAAPGADTPAPDLLEVRRTAVAYPAPTEDELARTLLDEGGAARVEPVLAAALRRTGGISPIRESTFDVVVSKLLADGRPEEAVAVGRMAVAALPRSAGASRLLADARREAGDLRGAIEAYRRCLELDPGDPCAREALRSLVPEN